MDVAPTPRPAEVAQFLSVRGRVPQSSRQIPALVGTPVELAAMQRPGYLNIKSLTLVPATLAQLRKTNSDLPNILVKIKGGPSSATLGFLKTYTRAMFGRSLKTKTDHIIFLMQPDNLRAIEENNALTEKEGAMQTRAV